MDTKPNNPRRFKTMIRSVKETAFQRAIWLCEYSKLDGKNVRWLDIELPVDQSGNARGKCIDLIGVDDKGNYVICELKFGTPGRGSPLKAAKQVEEYYREIEKHASTLRAHEQAAERGGIDWKRVASKSTFKIVAANEEYWNYWCKRLKSVVPDSVSYYKLPIESSIFDRQKKKNGTTSYTPEISKDQNKWFPVLMHTK